MIVKQWDGSQFLETYPKTKASMIYAPDGTTQIFDANSKIKVAYLPNEVFDNLKYSDVVTPSDTLKNKIEAAILNANGALRSPNGYYFVVSTGGTFNALQTAEPGLSGEYVSYTFRPGDGSITETVNVTLEAGDWFIITEISGTGTFESPYVMRLAVVNNTYDVATSSTSGIVKLGNNTVQSVAAASVSATANRTYATQLNGSGQLVVNVPWVNTTYSALTSSALGLARLTSDTTLTQTPQSLTTTADRTYAIQKNASDQLVVNVPWTEGVTSPANASTLGLIKLGNDTQNTATAASLGNTNGRTYLSQVNASGQLVVNVPWVNTTYGAHPTGGLTLDSTNFRMTYPFFVGPNEPTPAGTHLGAIWFDTSS